MFTRAMDLEFSFLMMSLSGFGIKVMQTSKQTEIFSFYSLKAFYINTDVISSENSLERIYL